MKINVRLRLEILRPGARYGWKGDGDDAVQTEAQYNTLIVWPDTGPTWAEVIAVGDIELDLIVRATKRLELETELLQRIQDIVPAITSMDMLEWEREKWRSILPAARNPTTTFTSVMDNYTAARDAWLIIKTLTEAQITSYNVKTDPIWP